MSTCGSPLKAAEVEVGHECFGDAESVVPPSFVVMLKTRYKPRPGPPPRATMRVARWGLCIAISSRFRGGGAVSTWQRAVSSAVTASAVEGHQCRPGQAPMT